MTQLPTIALTMGDPAGVGPEVILKALADPAVAGMAHWVVLGDRRVMEMAGAPKDDSFYQRAAQNRTEKIVVDLPQRVPIRVF